MSQELIKNIAFSQSVMLASQVEYQQGRVVSVTLAQKPAVTMTLFAFDEGERISTHAASGDAFVYILDGRARITIADQTMEASAGQAVVMPATIPHGLEAINRFKMLLVVVKPER